MTPERPLEFPVLLTNVVTALLVSPATEDHAALRRIFHRANWVLYTAETMQQAREMLRLHRIPVVITDQDLSDGGWRDFCGNGSERDVPRVIVAHRFSECRNLAALTNAGAYDVLPKPFEATEVKQSVGFAWFQWKRDHGLGHTGAPALRVLRKTPPRRTQQTA
jgi:DNA-binding NtrC family response regulator